MSTAVQADLMDLSLSELTDQAIALGGDFHLAREIGNVRHKKTWIKLIGRLTSLDVEVVEEVEPESEPEPVHHESRRDMMLAEVERTRQIFEGDLTDDIPANIDWWKDHGNTVLGQCVLSHFLRGEVEEFGSLDDIETWQWADKFATIEKVLKQSPPFKGNPFVYEKRQGYFGDYFQFKPIHLKKHNYRDSWLELHRLPELDEPWLHGENPKHYYMLVFPYDGLDTVDMDDDIKLNNENIVIWDNRDGFFPLRVDEFVGEVLSFKVGDALKWRGGMTVQEATVTDIYFPTIQHIKEVNPLIRLVDGYEVICTLSDIEGYCNNAVDYPPPPPEKPPIVYPVPVITPVAPWEKCNDAGSDRRECDKPIITERGTGREPATSGSICHVCEGTGNILSNIECVKKGYLTIADKVLFTAQNAVQTYIKKVSEQVRSSMVSLPIEQVKVMAKELMAADLLAGSERNLAGISKAIGIAMKYAPAVLPPFPWMKLKNRQAFLAVEKLDGYDFPFSNYYVGQLPYWQDVYLYLFPSCNDAEKYLNSILICGDFAVLEV